MPIRIMNMCIWLVNLKDGMKVGDLLPIETYEKQLCLTAVTNKHKEQPISEIIDSSLKDKASMLTENKKEKLD